MRKLSLYLTICLIPITSLFANDALKVSKVVYGDDNRVEVADANPKFAQWARSTAGMISKRELIDMGDSFKITGGTLEGMGVCASERFSQQLTLASCSGFLVGDDLLVTAGHCITNEGDCSNNVWIFDYNSSNTEEGTRVFNAKKNTVYSCKKIISRSQSMLTKNDYALIKLDRKVTDRTPLKVSKRKPKVGTELVVIGHPTGLPTKIADGAQVRKKHWKYFSTNLDTFGGNSGSAVLNAETGKVLGILVRGDRDYRRDSAQGCQIVNQCSNSGCRGEDVTYIKNVRKL